MFEDERLIIVVTQFDVATQPDDSGEDIPAEEVQEDVCQFVSEACPDVKMSRDDVLPLSGLWAYNARMLTCHPDGRQHSTYRTSVERSLSICPSIPRGEGESRSSFLGARDDELAEKLLEFSLLNSLEARYNNC